MLPKVINYAIRFPAELRSFDSGHNWGTNYKLGDEVSTGPRNMEKNDGGLPGNKNVS